MSMNPRSEDFERLAIRWADAPHAVGAYPNLLAAISAFPELYAKDRDKLPQNDSDRAFALMGRAAQIIDRSVVTAETEDAAAELALKATSLLDEALKLDPACYDAVRIRKLLDRPTREEMESFLADSAEEVREVCWGTARENGLLPPDGRWSASVYVRPYLRWLLDLANESLSCGRYRRALDTCLRLLELDEVDFVGARHVAAYVYVKLEDAQGLARFMECYPGDSNAWFLLSRCFMAYKQRRLDVAASVLHQIVRTFPASGCTLSYQDELPPGVFGHLEYADGTADELFVAVSEAAVILDENCGDFVSPLSDWIARDPVVEEARASEEARAQAAQPAQREQRQPAPRAPRPPAPANADELAFADVNSVEDLLAALGGSDADAGTDDPQGDADNDPSSADPTSQGR